MSGLETLGIILTIALVVFMVFVNYKFSPNK